MDYELDGKAYIYVHFTVKGIIYNKNEIIAGCKVINRDSNGSIQCVSKYCSIHIRRHTIHRMMSVKRGQPNSSAPLFKKAIFPWAFGSS